MRKYFCFAVILAALGFWTGCSNTQNHVLYAALPSTSQVAGYSISGGGSLSSIGSPASAGTTPVSIAIHPSNKFLYAANSASNNISVFTISGGGELNGVATNSVAGVQPVVLAMTPSGNFLYAADAGANTVAEFSIDPGSGNLSALPGSPFQVQAPPSYIIADPGNRLYVAAPGKVYTYAIQSDGTLSSSSTPASITAATLPSAMAIDPGDHFLYVSDLNNNMIIALAIQPDGTLTPIATAALDGQRPSSLVVDPSGQYLFVADQASSEISGFAIQSSGALSLIAGSPFASGTMPTFLSFSTAGFLLVSDPGTSTIWVHSMDPTSGALTTAGQFPTTEPATWIAVLDR